MSTEEAGLFRRRTRSGWVRLRTLILLRWLAIAGQTAAIAAADLWFGMQFNAALAYLVVAASVIANVVAVLTVPVGRRLTEFEAMLTLLFDIVQLGFLLHLTGGLNNPFAMLILAPVTISATALQLRTTVSLGLVALAMVTLNALFHQPMRLPTGEPLALPPLFELGHWLAIVIGIVFLGLYTHRVASEIHAMSQALLATQMALAREQKLTDLGGVVAAAAHELGTPLATIKLVSGELADELAERPELRADAELIRAQADRCRDIMRSMGRAGKADSHLRRAPLETLLREAAEPHAGRGKHLAFSIDPQDTTISVQRRPEVIHGLRNLIQNAVDFARGSVEIAATADGDTITVQIRDDGPGFSSQVLARIGDPFMRTRDGPVDPQRPDYEGMGLGLFIAKTLLERSGARIEFANAAQGGAQVTLSWPRGRLETARGGELSPNQTLEA